MIRRIIGIILIALPIYPVGASIWLFSDTNEKFQEAQEAILLSSDELQVGVSRKLEITYPHAHGIWVTHAVLEDDAALKDIILSVQYSDPEVTLSLIHVEGEKALIPHRSVIEITKSQDFNGQVQFKNMVCGCEKMGPGLVMLIMSALGALFMGTGLFLILKKPKSKLTSPAGDAPDSQGTP